MFALESNQKLARCAGPLDNAPETSSSIWIASFRCLLTLDASEIRLVKPQIAFSYLYLFFISALWAALGIWLNLNITIPQIWDLLSNFPTNIKNIAKYNTFESCIPIWIYSTSVIFIFLFFITQFTSRFICALAKKKYTVGDAHTAILSLGYMILCPVVEAISIMTYSDFSSVLSKITTVLFLFFTESFVRGFYSVELKNTGISIPAVIYATYMFINIIMCHYIINFVIKMDSFISS